ncbi:MAG: hypothetical protein KDC07_05595, partial [Chitinophagaceae bacterium]|nr:hypothetical protein [Chitinophagaceae bacterium]
MKKILLPVLLLLFVNGYAQTRDLISLAKGDFLGMNALFDEDESLFGYISIYDYGKTGDKTKKFEYVLLDKNLNPFANNTFEGDITAGDYYGYINFDGAIVLKPSSVDYSLVKPNDMFTPSSMVIDLKDNSVKRKVFYDYDHGVFNELEQNDTWRDKRKEFRTEKKQNSFNYISTVAEIKEGGYLVHEYDAYRGYVQNSHLMRYDENKKEMWRYSYNETATKKQWQVLYALEKDEKYYYALLKN